MHGALYGTAGGGGSANCSGGCGVAFKLSPAATTGGKWTETILYAFKGGSDGGAPQANLIADVTGALYGTTATGGSSNCSGGCGTVFKLTPPRRENGPWIETVLHAFTGGADGHAPLAGLIADATGALYGTTSHYPWFASCLAQACGTVFKLAPPAAGGKDWTETVLHDFADGSDGTLPVGGLTMGRHGELYGTTYYGIGASGGSIGVGTVFKLSPPASSAVPWTEAVIYAFQGGKDGDSPQTAQLAITPRGVIYGTTPTGGQGSVNCGAGSCGAVYELAPPSEPGGRGVETVLDAFQGGPDGSAPQAGVIRIGNNLYGTTSTGGGSSACPSGCGTIYRLKP